MSSKDNDEERLMHSKNNDIELMIYDEEDRIIEGMFLLILSIYQIWLEKSMKGSDFFP